jgi:hypothetical protein
MHNWFFSRVHNWVGFRVHNRGPSHRQNHSLFRANHPLTQIVMNEFRQTIYKSLPSGTSGTLSLAALFTNITFRKWRPRGSPLFPVEINMKKVRDWSPDRWAKWRWFRTPLPRGDTSEHVVTL